MMREKLTGHIADFAEIFRIFNNVAVDYSLFPLHARHLPVVRRLKIDRGKLNLHSFFRQTAEVVVAGRLWRIVLRKPRRKQTPRLGLGRVG